MVKRWRGHPTGRGVEGETQRGDYLEEIVSALGKQRAGLYYPFPKGKLTINGLCVHTLPNTKNIMKRMQQYVSDKIKKDNIGTAEQFQYWGEKVAQGTMFILV